MTTDAKRLTDANKDAIDKAAAFLAPIFQQNGWTYGWNAFTPDRDDLAQTITELAQTLLNDDDVEWTSSGRITLVRSWNNEDGTDFNIEIKLDVGEFHVEPREETVLDRVRRIAENAERVGFDSPELVEIRRLLAEVS